MSLLIIGFELTVLLPHIYAEPELMQLYHPGGVEGLAVALLGAIEGIETQRLVARDLDRGRAIAALRVLVLAMAGRP